jgi:hypothetical protein
MKVYRKSFCFSTALGGIISAGALLTRGPTYDLNSLMNEFTQTAENTALNVAVLAGGESTEADVSRRSAAEVHKALSAYGHNSSVIELGPPLCRFVTQITA